MGPVGYAGTSRPPLGFTAVPASLRDAVVVPTEYEFQVLYRWGDPTGIGSSPPAFRPDASNTAEDQALQAGMHHDGMHFFPLGSDGRRALLVLNHEYTDEHQLHADGAAPLTAAKVRKSQHAVGVSVIEIERLPSGWRQVLPSGYARRIHARTPMHIAGPAAGSALLRTAADPSGREVLGTLANCAMGVTPWGTYLTCEENFHGYFGADKSLGGTSDAAARRYGTTPGGQWVDWYRFDERFDVLKHPNESHRFGWVVEIDPMDPASPPIKRTALGRKCTESATCTLTRDGRVAVYMGDDGKATKTFVMKGVTLAGDATGATYTAPATLPDRGDIPPVDTASVTVETATGPLTAIKAMAVIDVAAANPTLTALDVGGASGLDGATVTRGATVALAVTTDPAPGEDARFAWYTPVGVSRMMKAASSTTLVVPWPWTTPKPTRSWASCNDRWRRRKRWPRSGSWRPAWPMRSTIPSAM